jgi:hypothetical protein
MSQIPCLLLDSALRVASDVQLNLCVAEAKTSMLKQCALKRRMRFLIAG